MAGEAHNDDIVSLVSWKNDIETWLQVENASVSQTKTHLPTQRVMLLNIKKKPHPWLHEMLRNLWHSRSNFLIQMFIKENNKKKTSCSHSQHESCSIFLLISAHKKAATEISQCLVQLSLNEHYVLFIFSLFAWIYFFSHSLSVLHSLFFFLSLDLSEWVSVSCGVTAFRMGKFTMSLHFYGAFNFVFFAWFLMPTNVYEYVSLCAVAAKERSLKYNA